MIILYYAVNISHILWEKTINLMMAHSGLYYCKREEKIRNKISFYESCSVFFRTW